MKKYLAIILLLLMVTSCVKGPKEAVISGKILNFTDSVVYLSKKGIFETIKVKSDKSFEYKTIISKPELYTILFGQKGGYEIYISPGDSTKVDVDFKKMNLLPNFQGRVNEANYFIIEKRDVISKYISDYKSVFSLPVKDFYTILDSLKFELNEKVKEISNKDLAELESIRTDYYILNLKADYPQFNSYYTGVKFNQDSIDYSFFNGFDVNNSYHLMFKEYFSLVNKFLTSKLLKDVELKIIDSIPPHERISKYFMVLDQYVTNPEVRDYYKQSAFMEDLSNGEFWKFNELINKYLAECQTAGYRDIIEKLYNHKMLLAPGQPAPLFWCEDINGKEYSLDEFKGNLIYIDFWATWSGPSRSELPFLDEIEKAYEGKKITFISISVDNDMIAWKKMVKEKKMKGLQLHANGAENSSVAKDYQIKGIPSFALIDADGLIISPSAPRPSSGSVLVNLLDENLAKIK